MTTPHEKHQALAAAIERVAEVARAAQGKWHAVDGFAFGLGMSVWSHIALHDPASVLDRTARDRERAERHRPGPLSYGVPRCDMQLHATWPCLDYRDLCADYGIEVP